MKINEKNQEIFVWWTGWRAVVAIADVCFSLIRQLRMWVVKKWEWEQVFLYVKKNVSHGKKNNQTSKRKIDKFYLSKKKGKKKAQICHAIFHHIIVFGSSARGGFGEAKKKNFA